MAVLATAVGRTLADLGVRHAFGVVGGGNILLTAGLTGAGISYVPARHEGGAMAMADAYHRTTGQVAICTTSHGPGLTNIATALTEATKHGSGALVICGDAPSLGLRSHDIDQPAFVGSIPAPVLRTADRATALRTTVDALDLARTTSRPVVLCVPNDMVSAEVSGQAPVIYPAASSVVPVVPADLDAVLDALAKARCPLLLAGLGAWRSGAGKVLVELGERIGALYATTTMASGLFAGSRWSLGVFGGFAAPRAAAIIGSADLVIAFGASLDAFTLHHDKLLHPDAVLAQIDLADDRAIDRVSLSVTADASAAAEALLNAVNARGLPPSTWRDELADAIARAGWEHESYDDAGTDSRIDPRTLTAALAGVLPQERTVVLDGGHFIEWPSRYLPVPEPSAMVFMGAAFQTIGLGFAGAVGAAVGRPDRLTVAALGDGGALMGLPELETLVRTGASALVVVYDDAAYGFEVHMYGPKGADLRTAAFGDTDFAGIARSLGATAVTVRRIADLWIVRTWLARGCPGTLFLDCKVVPQVVARFLSDLIAG
ncbi:thiamine pyrophosphate-binding protein [Micromonospora sp. WMMA1363]|uniref:thiamine pyrophosphate-binding protein n=1 Tax=Micromonospora sp. WMMA1363 TaxID=3053985 RepID=UPI00259CD279|nr:thiamine pyrophosphate-binding protein [Micromonospora sp. WMMA1363]MDM4719669.1 thiamine pyrophosphate-binding protein [Micromonospora sp. WMMA1363]